MWILWKLRFQKSEFCGKWDFRNLNSVKNEISEMWILWKMRFQKGEFCKNCDFQYLCEFPNPYLQNCIRYLWQPLLNDWRALGLHQGLAQSISWCDLHKGQAHKWMGRQKSMILTLQSYQIALAFLFRISPSANSLSAAAAAGQLNSCVAVG